MNKTRFTMTVAGAAILLGGVAQAQPVRPNILIIFDTSTSMLSSNMCPNNATGGDCDGSPLCNDRGQDSRLFRLKQALRDTLTEVGTDEANFGLARFPQIEDPADDNGCFRGHYLNSVTNGNSAGCKTSAASETADGAWYSPTINREVVVVPVTRTVPPTTADYDPLGANIVQIHRWLDNREVSDGTQITDPEIRSGGGKTPLAASLFYARLYFDRFVKPVDPKGTCRKNIVIFATDGAETCVAESESVMRATELFGAGVKLYVVVQTGESGTNHDNMAAAGGTGSAIRVDFTNPTATKAVFLNIIAEAVPPNEVCNGRDDNCNNQVDEAPLPGVGDQCLCPGLTEAHVGKGMCKKGAMVCRGAAGLACEGCVGPQTELCNGLDDDCDGDIDEDFKVPGRDLGKSCDNGLRGACRRQGTVICTPDGSGVFCDAPMNVMGTTEICNGIDDDCDGNIDASPLPGENESCGANLGVCMGGRTKCEGGKFICVGQMSMGTKEICNGLDDNCNGVVDEMIDGVGEVCACGNVPLMTLMTGECRPGKKVCKGREPLDCEGCVLPRPEICDGKDNDCDGMTDTNAPCVSGRVCMEGKCEILCRMEEFPCPPGYRCNMMFQPPVCQSTKCLGVMCATGTQCDEGTGMCRDLCEGIRCPDPQICRGGRCQDCYTVPCPNADDVCVAGRCQQNPCAGKNCGAGAFCDSKGECVALCQPACPSGERCVRGKCERDACQSALCGDSQVCDPSTGMCTTDLCKISGRPCPGQKCIPITGMCADDPCAVVTCPGNCARCQTTADGIPQCVSDPNCASQRTNVTTRGGGCSCRTGGGTAGGPAGLALLLGLALALRRRRR